MNEQDKLTERMNLLESQHAFQEDIIEQLNKELAIHQAQIADLKEQINLLAQRVKGLKGSQMADESEETPPPHY